jgi:hypothetical protein
MLASPATDTAVAVGTSAAAVVALVTLAFLCYQWARDRWERRRLEEQKQAARINCWFIQTSAEFSDQVLNPEFRITGKLEWLNRSDDPVYSVVIIGTLATQEIHGFPIAKRRAIPSPDVIPVPVIAPGSNEVREYTWRFDIDGVSMLTTEFVLSWRFTDARGVTWLKTSRGHMEKMKSSPEASKAMAAFLLPSLQYFVKEATSLANEVEAKVKEAEEAVRKYVVHNEGDTPGSIASEVEAKVKDAEEAVRKYVVHNEGDTPGEP